MNRNKFSRLFLNDTEVDRRYEIKIILSAFIVLLIIFYGKQILWPSDYLAGDLGSFFYPQRVFYARIAKYAE